MDLGQLLLVGLALVLLGVALARGPGVAVSGVLAGGRMLRGVWLELLLGFLCAGLLAVLLPRPALAVWLGAGSPARGILVGWLIGLVLPGGPYVLFPIAAGLVHEGAAPGPVLTLLAAKTMASVIRALTYEAPILGWPLTLARLLPAALMPPLLGLAGQWLYRALKETPP